MSVHVDIRIADGMATRHLEINRITNVGIESSMLGFDIREMVSDYEVILSGGSRADRVVFKHRFGDDVFMLIQEAVAALREVVPVL